MSVTNVNNWQESFEQVNPTAFLLGAVLFVIAIVGAITLVEPGFIPESVLELLFVVIFVSVAIGLGGLYANVSHRSGRLAGIGAFGAGITGAFSLLILVVIAGVTAIGWNPGVIELIAWTGALAGLAIGFLAFGAAIWRSDVLQRVLGGLLVAGGIFLLAYITNMLLWQHEGIAMVFRVLWGLTLIGVAYSLRTESIPSDHPDVDTPREPA